MKIVFIRQTFMLCQKELIPKSVSGFPLQHLHWHPETLLALQDLAGQFQSIKITKCPNGTIIHQLASIRGIDGTEQEEELNKKLDLCLLLQNQVAFMQKPRINQFAKEQSVYHSSPIHTSSVWCLTCTLERKIDDTDGNVQAISMIISDQIETAWVT